MNEERYDVRQELRSDIWFMIIIAATLISAFFIYGRLPEKIPTHWNIKRRNRSIWDQKQHISVAIN